MSDDNTDATLELNRRTFVGVAGAGLVGAAAAGTTGADDGGRGDGDGDGGGTGGGNGGGSPTGDGSDPLAEITLITGDRVRVTDVGDGEWAVDIDPAERDGYEPSFDTVEYGDDVYVIPSDATTLIPETLDRELFNVRKLVEVSPYTPDGTTPAIVTYPDGLRVGTMDAAGVQSKRTFSSIDGESLTVESATFWKAATAADAGAAGAGTTGVADVGTFAGIEKLWLNGPVTADLHDSVEQTGAPTAWDLGYDGEGSTIAVLDTGIDESHEDIGEKVVASENFSSDDTVDDLHGHGTHVAATAAGTGDASDGDRVGVAPGADLVNGKVLNEAGGGTEDDIIAGMEWAAAQGVDAINMSLGGGATDGTDPMSQAVNELTDDYDVTFVVSAGNAGPSDESVTTPAPADAAVAVGAVDKDGELAFFSSRGPRVGDYAIKPDVTAPGVDIVAARADDTEMGSPVDDDYTEASGTSMSAPHVAGAVAILAQKEGGLSPAELKSAVASTASVDDALTVYEQGGGELDVAAAVETDVVATPAPLDLGAHEYPHDDADPVVETLSLTNHSDDAVTLDLDVDVTDDEDEPADDEMLTVEPSSVTVEPGETEAVEVTLDLTVGETALYGGWITASEAGETVLTVSTGYYKQPEQHELTVEGYMADGRTARRASNLDVMNVDDRDEFFESGIGFDDGVATVNVPPGTYSVVALITTLDEDDAFFEGRTVVGEPEIEITEDTEVVLDAQEANPVEVETMHDEVERPDGAIAYSRADAHGGRFTRSASGDTPVYAVDTDPVETGEFEFYTEHTFVAPALVTRAVEPAELEVDASYMTGSPAFDDGTHELPMVYAGLGYPEDFEEVDADGAVALIKRGEFSFADKAINAYEAGAEAAIIFNDEPEDFNGTVGDDGVIPTFDLSGDEGDALVELLEEDDVTFEFAVAALSPFQYELLLPEPDAIPEDLHYEIGDDDVATIDAGYYSDVEDQEINISHANWRPYQTIAITFTDRDQAPQERTEFVSANDTRWQKTVYMEPAFDGGVQEPQTFYEGAETREKLWHKQVASPGLIEGADHHPSSLPVRDGDTLDLVIPEWSDAQAGLHRHWGHRDLDDETAFRLYEDGDLVAEDDRAVGAFDVSEESRLRLELDVARDADWWETSTETETAWELDSSTTDEAEPLPLVVVDYDIDLDLLNRAPHPSERRGPFTLDFHARHPRGVDAPDVVDMQVWTSDDDGDSWRKRTVQDRGDGEFRVRLDQRDPDETTGYTSLRIEASDADDNTIEQEVIRAYALKPRD